MNMERIIKGLNWALVGALCFCVGYGGLPKIGSRGFYGLLLVVVLEFMIQIL